MHHFFWVNEANLMGKWSRWLGKWNKICCGDAQKVRCSIPPDMMQSCIGCIWIAFPRCVFSNESLKHLHKRMQIHTDCTCLAFLNCVFSWGCCTLPFGHLPNIFCFIFPTICFISPSNLLHLPKKMLHFPNKLLHLPNGLLHFPMQFCVTFPILKTRFNQVFSIFRCNIIS